MTPTLCIISGCNGAGKTTLARERGFRVIVHYVMIGSAQQAVERVKLRVKMGGHHVPDEDVMRRFDRSIRHLLEDYLPLADEWGVWDNRIPPPREIASNTSISLPDLVELLRATKLMEKNPVIPNDTTAIVLEAGRVATEKMLDYYRRMGIRVTPEMTLAPEPKKRARKQKSDV